MELTVKNLYTGKTLTHNKKITIENGYITAIADLESENYQYEYLAPALVDIHINGGEKHHFTASPTEEALKDIEVSGAKNGVGFLLPALITSSLDNIFKAIEVTQKYIADNPHTGILGLHLEGPFISESKRGAHLTKYIRKPDNEILEKIINKANGVVKMITIAPEYFSNQQIKMLLDAGIAVSLGHSNCTYKRAMEVFDLGVNLVTHLYNAMSAFHHREPGLVGAALDNENVYTPIIPDGVHADFDAVRFAFKNKKDKLFFISDALFQNHIKQNFKWEEFDVQLINGDYINKDGNLAGATISMADCIWNTMQELDISLEEAIHKSSTLPAKVLNLPLGKIEVGYPAKFCVINRKNINLLA